MKIKSNGECSSGFHARRKNKKFHRKKIRQNVRPKANNSNIWTNLFNIVLYCIYFIQMRAEQHINSDIHRLFINLIDNILKSI